MRMKKPLSMGIVAMLVLTMATLMAPLPTSAGYTPHNAPAIWMDPNFTDTLEVCENFTVSIVVNASAPYNLYLWQYNLYWNSDWISLVSYTPVIKSKADGWRLNWTQGENISYVTNTIKDSNEHLYAVCSIAPNVGYSGVTWLCNYTFHVDDAPIQPAAAYIGNFTLWLESLADDNLDEIIPGKTETSWVIGQYRIHPIPAPKPKLIIDPKKTQGVCSQKFNITIKICNLVKEWNLWGWEVNLTYDTSYLDALASYEGPFLPSFVVLPSAGTSYVNMIDFPAAGKILTAGSFNDPNHTAPECPGTCETLCYLEFNASVQTIAPEVVETDFALQDVKLVGVYPNMTEYPIPMLPAENATYNVPYKVVGWFLDCYTDPARKKVVDGVTEYIGLGLNKTADSYETQDLVILYAYLEYNFQPESNKIVMFEIYGPNRTISIIRTAITNCSGIATIQFTIPNIPAAFGHWVCYQAAQVKIYEKPEDWLWWKVGWIVEIMSVEVEPQEVKKCEEIMITLNYRTISFTPCWVLFTVVVLDELLDPIQEEVWWVYVLPTEPYLCSERWDYTVEWSHIPCYAHAGFATVYANAFTDFPMLCGCPFCPEETATFYILAAHCCW